MVATRQGNPHGSVSVAYLREMANGTALVEHMPIILGFLNHIVVALNKFTYQLISL